MITIKTANQIQKMKVAGDELVKIHHALKDFIKPGISTMDVEHYVEDLMRQYGVTPEQKGYMGYPYAVCASVNDEICHGFPREEALKEGDLVTIDMVVNKDGWLADSAWTYAVGAISDEDRRLMDVTKACLYRGIQAAQIGNRLGDIGHAIQSYAEENGFSVVREFVGHGIGRQIHEDPQVLHYGQAGRGIRLQEGMVFTIEPMINAGVKELTMDDNGWTARTRDGRNSAQYEHTLAITKDGPLILTEQGGGY